LAHFARSADEIEIANVFNESFAQEFHIDRPHSPLKRLHWEALGDAMNELHTDPRSCMPPIAEPFCELQKMLESVHAMLVRQHISELQRTPSAAQAMRVLELQQTHQLVEEEIGKNAKERP
jgi:hypothetical protein